MNGSSKWRKTRQRQHYRQIWEQTDNALHALALLHAHNDETIDLGDNTNRIKTNINNALPLLESLTQTSKNPAQGPLEEIQLLEDTNITTQQLEDAHKQLSNAKESLSLPPNHNTLQTLLKDIEAYAQRRAKR